VGQQFDAFVTGASSKGTFVRVVSPPIEGMLVSGGHGVDVGDHLRVRLTRRRRARLYRFQRLNHEGHKAIPNLKTA
jgi:exoribonuclease-2